MTALFNALQPLLEFSGLVVILLFLAWAFVTVGSLADSGTLLRDGYSKAAGTKRHHNLPSGTTEPSDTERRLPNAA